LFEHIVNNVIYYGGYAGMTAVVFAETGLLVGFFLPGDSLLVTAGIFAAAGKLNIAYLCGLLCVAAVSGSAVGYFFGLKTGKKLFTREDSLFFSKKNLTRSHDFYQEHGGMTIVLARFIPIIRTFAPIVAGVAEMDFKKFTAYNIVGGVGWVLSLLFFGFLLGSAIPDVGKHLEVIISAVIAVSMLPVIIKFWRERSKKTG
jgi:membrane-associated protein